MLIQRKVQEIQENVNDTGKTSFDRHSVAEEILPHCKKYLHDLPLKKEPFNASKAQATSQSSQK